MKRVQPCTAESRRARLQAKTSRPPDDSYWPFTAHARRTSNKRHSSIPRLARTPSFRDDSGPVTRRGSVQAASCSCTREQTASKSGGWMELEEEEEEAEEEAEEEEAEEEAEAEAEEAEGVTD